MLSNINGKRGTDIGLSHEDTVDTLRQPADVECVGPLKPLEVPERENQQRSSELPLKELLLGHNFLVFAEILLKRVGNFGEFVRFCQAQKNIVLCRDDKVILNSPYMIMSISNAQKLFVTFRH
ncbi:hypothetical protein BTVI_44230 [Pitangus sulphuratus]|nr:hypothetical protein BTVI_44230 [Pitangus sulphuratus]